MIQSFVEDLPPGSMLVRGGEGACIPGSHYRLSVVAIPDGTTAIIKGFTDDQKVLEKEYIEALKRALGPRGFTQLQWIRRKYGADDRILTIPIEERFMSVDAAYQHAATAIDHAIAAFTKDGDADLAAAWQAVKDAHKSPADIAAASASIHDRYQALDPLVQAVSNAVTLGLGHPDQSKPGHAAAKSALRAMHAVSVQVQNEMMAPIAAG